ncbi:MAG: acyltransferase family protein [Alphaproteobacteria bacterium]|nr:acyltransferase family protein [Alphaproteobacteria bacterium]
MEYRRDIDGLRALAVLTVIGFHLKFQGFGGGFIGVDVFFVISGFLITQVIRNEAINGQFSLMKFYERRARRLLPALFVVMAATVILSALVLLPIQYVSFSRSLIAASLFFSSFHFRAENGYFDLTSEQKPLLHTWSLSVEEIYYVFFPLLLIWIYRNPTRIRLNVLTLLGAISFIGATLALIRNPESKAAFFLPPGRAWEFLLGTAVAMVPLTVFHRRGIAEGAAILGVGLIVGAAIGYSEATVFPGPAALLPCLGTALIIAAGQQCSTLVTRLFSLPPIVWIGRASYSLYLWHWPLIVVSVQYLGEPLTLKWKVLIVVVSAFLSTLTLIWIETPFRGKNGILSRKWIFRIALLGIALFVAIGLHGILSNGWQGRFAPSVLSIVNGSQDKDPRQQECLKSDLQAHGCLYGVQTEPPTVALWGDSHAAVYAQTLGDQATQAGTSAIVYTMPSCPPIAGWVIPNQPWRDACLAFQDKAFREITESKTIKSVIFGARLSGYPYSDSTSDFSDIFRKTLKKIQDSEKHVAVLLSVPEFGANVPQTLFKIYKDSGIPNELTQDRAIFDQRIQQENLLLRSLPSNVIFIEPSKILCDATRCYFYRDGKVLYHDEHHLSLTGAAEVGILFKPLFGQ